MNQHIDKQIYKHIAIESAKDINHQSTLWQGLTLLARRCDSSESSGGLSGNIFDLLISSPRFKDIERVCIAEIIGNTNQLQVVDVHSTTKASNKMTIGYRCFVNPTGSLMSLSSGQVRIFPNSEGIIESYFNSGLPAQRSIRLIHEMGFRSGVCLPITHEGVKLGFLFLNSSKKNVFDNLDLESMSILILASLSAKSILLWKSQGLLKKSLQPEEGSIFSSEILQAKIKEIAAQRGHSPNCKIETKGGRFIASINYLVDYIFNSIEQHFALDESITLRVDASGERMVDFEIDGKMKEPNTYAAEYQKISASLYGYTFISKQKFSIPFDPAPNNMEVNYSI